MVVKYGQKTILMTMVQHLALYYHYQVQKCHDSYIQMLMIGLNFVNISLSNTDSGSKIRVQCIDTIT